MSQDLGQSMLEALDGKIYPYAGQESIYCYNGMDPLQAHYSSLWAVARRAERKAARIAANGPAPEVPKTPVQNAILTLRGLHAAPIDSGVPRLATILLATSQVTGVSMAELKGTSRLRNICGARQIYFWIARHYTPASFPQIGHSLGKDHTTVVHGVRKITHRLFAYQDAIDAIKKLAGVS